MDPKRRRELMLGSVAVLLLVAVVWGLRRGTGPSSIAAGPPATPPRASQAQPKTAIADVDLQALAVERPEPADSVRNPFRFASRPAPPPSAAIVKQQQQQAAAAAQAAIASAEPPPLPRIPLKYIGEMADPKMAGRRIAILSDARGVYYGSEGDVVEGRYRIVRIGVESIELAYLDGRGRQTIRQTGQ